MSENWISEEQWIRSQVDHPAGRHYRGPHDDDEPLVNARQDTDRDRDIMLLVFLTVAVLIVMVTVAQIWRASGWTGIVGLAAVISLGVAWWRR